MEALFTFGINQSEQSVFTFVHIVCIQITDWSYFPSAIFNFSARLIDICRVLISSFYSWVNFNSGECNKTFFLQSHLMAISITLQKVKKRQSDWLSLSEEKMSKMPPLSITLETIPAVLTVSFLNKFDIFISAVV